MTWIVGTDSYFGSALLISDICVTFTGHGKRKTYKDCLQKIYILGNDVIAGFSGSVLLGFHILALIQSESIKRKINDVWDMDIAANTWIPKIARNGFRIAPQREKYYGCSLIFASTHPTKNRGETAWPLTNIYLFSAPDFKPIKPATRDVVSIGSGSDVSYYKKVLNDIQTNESLLQMTLHGAEMHAIICSAIIRDTINKMPTEGVSKQVQIGIVARGKTQITSLVEKLPNPDGSEREIVLPPVAKGPDAFCQYCKSVSITAVTASC